MVFNRKHEIFQSKLRPRVYISVILLFIIFSCGIILTRPAAYLYLTPGPAFKVELTGKDIVDPVNDRYYFTTVDAVGMRNYDLIFKAFHPHRILIQEIQTLNNLATNNTEMSSSKLLAVAVAKALNTGTSPKEGNGVSVTSVEKDSPAEKAGLKIGDIIININNQGIKNVKDLHNVIKSTPNPLVMEYTKDQILHSVKLMKNSSNKIGVGVITYMNIFIRPDISIHTSGVEGSSAGLLFTLAALDALGKGDLTGGKIISGTGTIQPDGSVGEIEGADYKIVNAAKIGAKIFFVPMQNYTKSLNKYSNMQIVPVTNIREAINYLCSHGGNDQVCREKL